MSARVEIIDVVQIRDRAVVACDVLSGDVAIDLSMTVEGSSDVWTIVGTKSPAPELYESGRRGVTLAPQHAGQMLKAGDILTST